MGFMNEEERDALRQDIARHTTEFLRKGGKVIEVDPGFTGIGGNGLLSFRINNTENQQPRTNNQLFADGTKRKARKRKIDEVTTAVAGDGTTIDEDALDNTDGGTGL